MDTFDLFRQLRYVHHIANTTSYSSVHKSNPDDGSGPRTCLGGVCEFTRFHHFENGHRMLHSNAGLTTVPFRYRRCHRVCVLRTVA